MLEKTMIVVAVMTIAFFGSVAVGAGLVAGIKLGVHWFGGFHVADNRTVNVFVRPEADQ